MCKIQQQKCIKSGRNTCFLFSGKTWSFSHKKSPFCKAKRGHIFTAYLLHDRLVTHTAHIRSAMAVRSFFFWFVGHYTFGSKQHTRN
jgi:hypothetical protein